MSDIIETEDDSAKQRRSILAERVAKWRSKNREKYLSCRRAHRAANAERFRAQKNALYQKHLEKNREQDRQRYLRNIEKHSKKNATYYAQNKEKFSAYNAAYNKAHPRRNRPKPNPERNREMAHRRRAIKRAVAIGDLQVIAKWESTWRNKPRIKCYWCRNHFCGSACHLDHIVAIVNGGPHSIENLCVSCGPCNQSKHVKSLEAWNARIAEPVLF